MNSLEEDTFLNADSAMRNYHIAPIQATQPNVCLSVGHPKWKIAFGAMSVSVGVL